MQSEITPKFSLKEIEEKGYFTNKISYVKENFGVISDYISGCYNYFVKEASKRVPKPDEEPGAPEL